MKKFFCDNCKREAYNNYWKLSFVNNYFYNKENKNVHFCDIKCLEEFLKKGKL